MKNQPIKNITFIVDVESCGGREQDSVFIDTKGDLGGAELVLEGEGDDYYDIESKWREEYDVDNSIPYEGYSVYFAEIEFDGGEVMRLWFTKNDELVAVLRDKILQRISILGKYEPCDNRQNIWEL